MVEKPKNAENQQNGGNKAENANKPKLPSPLAEQKPHSVENSRLRDSERTIPIIYPPDLLDGEKSKQNSDGSKDDADAETAQAGSGEEDGKEKTEEVKNPLLNKILAKLSTRLKDKKEE